MEQEKDITSFKLACATARFLDDKKANDIVILDISNVSVLADYFVIASTATSTQVKALTSSTRELVKKNFGKIPSGEENDNKSRWNLLDYGDVIVHVLHAEERETYAIEKFWSHACTVTRDAWEEESKEFAMYKTE